MSEQYAYNPRTQKVHAHQEYECSGMCEAHQRERQQREQQLQRERDDFDKSFRQQAGQASPAINPSQTANGGEIQLIIAGLGLVVVLYFIRLLGNPMQTLADWAFAQKLEVPAWLMATGSSILIAVGIRTVANFAAKARPVRTKSKQPASEEVAFICDEPWSTHEIKIAVYSVAMPLIVVSYDLFVTWPYAWAWPSLIALIALLWNTLENVYGNSGSDNAFKNCVIFTALILAFLSVCFQGIYLDRIRDLSNPVKSETGQRK